MKKCILGFVLYISLMAQTIEIKTFDWHSESKVFSFSGVTSFSDGLKLKVSIVLNEQVGITSFVVTKQKTWSGYISFNHKKLIPGEYTLRVTIPHQRLSKHMEVWANHKDDIIEKKYFFQQQLYLDTWLKLREELAANVNQHRVYFDSAILKGNQTIWALQSSENEEEKQDLLQKWQQIKYTFPDYKRQKKIVMDTNINSVVIHPYANTIIKIGTLYDHLHQVQLLIDNEIMDRKKSFDALPFYILVQNIKSNVHDILKDLDSEIPWSYQVDMNRESGTLKDGNYSSNYGFRFFLGAPQKIISGDESSPLRLTAKYESFQIKVFVLNFPDTNREEKLKLWQLLSSYEWDLIEKEGQYILLDVPNSNKKRKVYSSKLLLVKEKKICNCVLFFSRGYLYCLLLESGDGDVGALDNFGKAKNSFEFR